VRLELHAAVVGNDGRFTHLTRDHADLDAIYHQYFQEPDVEEVVS
jgi:hypothetical protein